MRLDFSSQPFHTLLSAITHTTPLTLGVANLLTILTSRASAVLFGACHLFHRLLLQHD